MATGGEPDLETRKMMATAVRRLNLFEYLLLGATMMLALLGGAITALVLQVALEFPFRISWTVASLLLFIIPGAAVYLKKRTQPQRLDPENTKTSEGSNG